MNAVEIKVVQNENPVVVKIEKIDYEKGVGLGTLTVFIDTSVFGQDSQNQTTVAGDDTSANDTSTVNQDQTKFKITV